MLGYDTRFKKHPVIEPSKEISGPSQQNFIGWVHHIGK